MLVSILIPCYNAEQWVGQAIESALAQTWPEKEVVVVDDGSKDGSLDIIRGFSGRIRWETGPNRGGNRARNRLLELAHGEWLQYLDADDYLLPEKVERQLGELGDTLAVDCAYAPVIMEIWNRGHEPRQEITRIPGPHDPWCELVRWQLPQTGAALWRRSALVEVGGWKTDQPCCQEHELYLRLLKNGKAFTYCATPGAVYRIWSNVSVCRKNPLQTITRRLEIIDAAERHLMETRSIDDDRNDAIAVTRIECARTLYQLDRAAAIRVASIVRRRYPGHSLEPLPCFPVAYRWLYRLAGFRAAELAAGLARPWRRGRTA